MTAKVGLSGKARWFALGGIAAPCLLKVSLTARQSYHMVFQSEPMCNLPVAATCDHNSKYF